MGDNGAVQKIKATIYCRLTEIILTAFLSLAISAFAFNVNAQSKLAARLRSSEKEIALNVQKIDALKETMRENQATTSKQIDMVLKRVDERCNSLEALLNIIAKRTGGN